MARHNKKPEFYLNESIKMERSRCSRKKWVKGWLAVMDKDLKQKIIYHDEIIDDSILLLIKKKKEMNMNTKNQDDLIAGAGKSIWNTLDEKPPNGGRPKDRTGIYRVKLQNGDEINAYYYEDQIAWIAFYGRKIGYWWKQGSGERLDNVTHWKERERM